MADPASVIGLVISALGVATWIHEYISNCKDAPQHIKDLGKQVEVTAGALEILRQQLQSPSTRQIRLERTSILFVAAGGCNEQLRHLRKLLPSTWPVPKHKAMVHVLSWSSKKEDVAEALISLRGYVQVFHLTVDLDGLNSLSSAHHESSRYVQEKLQLLEAQGGVTSDEVEAVRHVMKDISNNLSRSIQSLGEKVGKIDLDNKKLRLLDALESLHFQEKHIDLQMRRTEGLGQWLLLEPIFVAWREASVEKRTLWCHGVPGAGKTYLASVIIDHLQDRVIHTGGRVLYFYFDYRQQSEQTPLKILATLLKQLIATYQGVPEGASKLFEHVVSGKDLPSWTLLVDAFIGICAQSEEVFLVLDAMDECDEHKNRSHILDLLECLEEQSQLRILITSRSYPSDIKEAFAEYPEVVIQAPDSDIHTFLSGMILNSRRTWVKRAINGELRERIIREIAGQSQGMFLLPALQIDYVLGQTSKSEVEQALRTLPSGLEQNLDLTIHRIKSQDSQGSSRADLALRVLAWLSNSAAPMKVEELYIAVTASLDDVEEGENVDSLIFTECCLGLVTVDSITRNVRLVHMSINEYLQSRFNTLMPRAHAIMAERCMDYLAHRQAKCSDQAPLSYQEVNTITSSSHFLGYATRYWGSHARDGFDAELEKSINDFTANQPVVNFWANLFLYYNSIWKTVLDPNNVYTNTWNRDLCYITGKFSPLHIAAVYGIGDLCRHVLDDRDTDVNVKDPFGRTPLILSATHGTTSICELLLDRNKVDVNAQDLTGNTALSIAALCKRVEIARRLIERPDTDINLGQPLPKVTGYLYFQYMFPDAAPVVSASQIAELLFSRDDLDVNLVGVGGYAPWEHISLDFNAEMLEILLSRKDFEPSPQSVNRTIPDLHEYSSNRQYRLHEVAELVGAVRVLIVLDRDERFTVDKFERCGLLISLAGIFYLAFASDYPHTEEADGTYKYEIADGPVIFDSSRGQIRGQVRAGLESHGLSLNFQDSGGRSFIHYSAWTGNLEHFDFFVSQGLDFTKRDSRGWTALHYAVANEQVEMTNRLLDIGLDANAVDDQGKAVLHVAAREAKTPAILELLLGRDASLAVEDFMKNTLLHEAAENANGAAIIQRLLDLGLDVNAVSVEFITPLHLATRLGNQESVDILLKNGAKPEAWSIMGTPLNCAAQLMDVGIAKRLIEAGADPDTKDILGKSSRYWLTSYPPFMEELLLEPTLNPEDPCVSKSLILQSMAERVPFMLKYEHLQSHLSFRLGRQLMLLGDDESAVVAFSRDITSQRRSRVVTWFEECRGCDSQTGSRFVCRSCAIVSFCSECVKGDRCENIPWCHDHEFLKVPTDGWSDLPEGKFDSAGRTFVEWLKGLQVRYDLPT